MRDVLSLKCLSAEQKLPTTMRKTCIDSLFINFDVERLQEPLSVLFADRKTVVVKAKGGPAAVQCQYLLLKNDKTYASHRF